MAQFHLHLISDATGETLHAISKAVLVQFEQASAIEHVWSLVRSERQLKAVIDTIAGRPGIVMFTLVDFKLREILEEACKKLAMPCVSVLDPAMAVVSAYLGATSRGLPGRQHEIGDEYFNRIEAMNFAMTHDDGQFPQRLAESDIILVGVSRTSKTPTSIYLANRGVKVANVPFVPNIPLPPELFELTRPLIVGLTTNPEVLIEIRRNRLLSLKERSVTDYVDPEIVREEVATAKRLFARHGWPTINVARRSIEETAATILNLYNRRAEERLNGGK
ncbi:pyruvate, water dikinase regulatory protein [Oceanibacterium hippocampi]|uniref:Putative pyruvate, phosphate dikinase regulatory protein n=1 Tax=Oceanibacterium hippocampi TaxID=745714 RepID=A0A1Y5RRA3_9PROT|nr:pyruvate, water dikinase regulatory protein [Oceanibacterium hippocampi]SLN20813.1 Putative pyruvate, phosphate dikinase regulatory protein [Oceanibacterium hippocampi]